MDKNLKPTHEQPGGLTENDEEPTDGMVNDSLGTTSFADSTGLDETKETGDAKDKNQNTHED